MVNKNTLNNDQFLHSLKSNFFWTFLYTLSVPKCIWQVSHAIKQVVRNTFRLNSSTKDVVSYNLFTQIAMQSSTKLRQKFIAQVKNKVKTNRKTSMWPTRPPLASSHVLFSGRTDVQIFSAVGAWWSIVYEMSIKRKIIWTKWPNALEKSLRSNEHSCT